MTDISAAQNETYGVKGHYAYSRICDGLTQEEADAEYDEWLAEHDRQAAERAWDEGAKAGMREANDIRRGDVNRPTLNPYRQEQADE